MLVHFILLILVSIVVLLNNASLDNLHLIQWPVFTVGLDQTHALHNLHAALDSSEYSVFPIKPRCRRQGDEELATICVWTAVRHAENACASMFECWLDFVLELLAIDRRAAASCTGWVTTLNHEVRYYAMEDNIVVVASLD